MVADRPVSEIMTHDVKTTAPDAWVYEAAEVMVEYDISGLPVLENGDLVGIVTESDLVSREMNIEQPTYISFLDAIIKLPWDSSDDEVRRVFASKVGELMTHPVYSVTHDATVRDVATLMFDQRVNPVPVLDDQERVVGIISRSDIVRLIAEGGREATEESNTDD